jgi:N-acetylglucosaminyldiphosphoundecaprenol N-acetyl-beta-D-mannosaminyltransferase
MTIPTRAPVVGTPISLTSYNEVLEAIGQRDKDAPMAVSICTVHSVMSARRDPELAAALNGSDIATPDGVPLVWALRWTANPNQERVYGPDLMRLAITDDDRQHWRHFLYGSSDATLAALENAITDMAPNAQIVGHISPPFRPVTEDEQEEYLDAIRASGADVVWVGLGMPKQELWMNAVKEQLPGVALVGVGAAFDFLAGNVKEAPLWMQRAALEWLYRLLMEPRRLWRRYIWNNPAFVFLLARQILKDRLTGGSHGTQADGDHSVST